MQLLAKKEGSALIVVALNLTDTTLPVLDNLIKAHDLIVVDYSPTQEQVSFYGPTAVTVEERTSNPFQSLSRVKFSSITPTAAQLAVWFNALALLYVNRLCMQQRNSWSKGLPYQDLVYSMKLNEAEEVTTADGDASSKAPMLAAEAKNRGRKLGDLAASVIAADNALKQRVIQSENLRTQFNQRAAAVSTLEDLIKFRAEFSSALEALQA